MQCLEGEVFQLDTDGVDTQAAGDTRVNLRRFFSGRNAPRVRILCKRSASLTIMTRISRDIASTIFWKFSAWATALSSKVIWVSLDTPSTSSATGLPNCSAMASLLTPVSSMTSCSMAAIRL